MIRNEYKIGTQFFSNESRHGRSHSVFPGDVISCADHAISANRAWLVHQPRLLQDFTGDVEHVHVKTHPNSTPATNFNF
jgi:hypothetical protein